MITRALGPEPNVQVDILEEPAHAGDLFLLCSDGLTSMVREPDLVPLLLGEDRSLEDIGRGLIAAANAAGGRDNITVVLFRLEEVDAPVGSAPDTPTEADEIPNDGETNEYDDLQRRGGRRAAPGRQPAHGPHARRRTPSAAGPATTRRPSTGPPGTVALSAVRPARSRSRRSERNHAPPAPKRRRKGAAGSSRPAS